MKSDFAHVCWIAVTSCLLVSLVVTPVESVRKCRGRWAIHACWGGNGKRSDPSLDQAARPSLLRQYLLREPPSYPLDSLDDGVDMAVDVPAEPEQLDTQSFSSSEYTPYYVSPSVDRLSALLRTLRTLQKENEDLP